MTGVAVGPIPHAVPYRRKTYGPKGANLFVKYLPKHYGEVDLFLLFSPYGKILSATVYTDSVTRESKCFGNCPTPWNVCIFAWISTELDAFTHLTGFVSYEKPEDAQRAIGALNRSFVDNKRLLVELKKSDGKGKFLCLHAFSNAFYIKVGYLVFIFFYCRVATTRVMTELHDAFSYIPFCFCTSCTRRFLMIKQDFIPSF